MPEMIRRSLDA